MVEEWKTHTSYDMGLETERAAREKLQKQSIHHEEVKRHISYIKREIEVVNTLKVECEAELSF